MTEATPFTLTERQQYWLKHIRACAASGQTSIDYAQAHGINVKSLYSARKGLAQKSSLPHLPSSRFQKAQLLRDSTAAECQWRIHLPNGTAIAFGGNVNAATLSLVLTATAALS